MLSIRVSTQSCNRAANSVSNYHLSGREAYLHPIDASEVQSNFFDHFTTRGHAFRRQYSRVQGLKSLLQHAGDCLGIPAQEEQRKNK